MKTYGENVKVTEIYNGNIVGQSYKTLKDGLLTDIDLPSYEPTAKNYRAIIDYTAYKLDIPDVMADGTEIHSVGHYTITDFATGEVLDRQELRLEVKREGTAIEHTKYRALEVAQAYGFKEKEFNLLVMDKYAERNT